MKTLFLMFLTSSVWAGAKQYHHDDPLIEGEFESVYRSLGGSSVTLDPLDISSGTIDEFTTTRATATSITASLISASTITATTRLIMPLGGGATTPGLAFDGDANTGLHSFQADSIIVGVGGLSAITATPGVVEIGGTFNLDPAGAGAKNFGNATAYWNDISYKTLTDRGCLGFFDSGVELRNGAIVSDTEAISRIQVHPTKETVYGVPMLDYRTFPKVAYKPADKNGVLIARNAQDEPVIGADGIEMTSMFSIMLGAIKELNERVKTLEASNPR